MKFLKHIFTKHRRIALPVLALVILVSLFSLVKIFAADPPPLGGFAPGATLDPDCLPGATDCVVTIPTGWSLLGNAGTVDGTNFIGTTDNIPLNIRVNNEKAGRIDNTLFNTFFGYQAGNANTAGSDNVANGYQALYSNTTGNDNIAVGSQALLLNTTGTDNVAIGGWSLNENVTGINNIAIGLGALTANTADDNVALGANALTNNTTGVGNTAVGSNAGLGIGPFNHFNDTGSNNTFIGYGASVDTFPVSYDNATAIGYNAMVGASNAMVLGGTGADAVNVGIGTATPGAKLHIADGTIQIDGTGAPATGGALCLNASSKLSKCTSAVDASGNCTCP